MKQAYAGILGGLAGGLTVSLAMVAGRRAGVLHKTLAEDAEDWLDRMAGTRQRIGKTGTTTLEQANHLAAAGAFGFFHSILRRRALSLPAWALGALYGAGLYVVNIVGIAPLIGLTEGERDAPPSVRVERLAVHVLYGVVTALVMEMLTDSQLTRR
jgi:hypothetical protein